MVYTGVVLLYMSFWNQWIGRVIWTLDMVLMTCILLLIVMDMLKNTHPQVHLFETTKEATRQARSECGNGESYGVTEHCLPQKH